MRKTHKFLLLVGIVLAIIFSIQIGKGNVSRSKLQMLSFRLLLPRNVEDWSTYLFDRTYNYCNKKTPYEVRPEFSRSISLITQRIQDFSKQYDEYNIDLGIYPLGLILKNKNCLDIQYALSASEMSGADGLFLFSSEFSSKDRLKILVNPEYKAQDDLMTALLLSHEITHAEDFIEADVYNTELERCNKKLGNKFCLETVEENFKDSLTNSCFEMEQRAFYTQFFFYMKLKESEHSSLLSKYIADYKSKYNLPIISIMDIYTKLILSTCNPSLVSDSWQCINDYFGNFVVESPYYQEQCVGKDKIKKIMDEFNTLKTKQEKSDLWKKYVNEGVIDKDTAKVLKLYLTQN